SSSMVRSISSGEGWWRSLSGIGAGSGVIVLVVGRRRPDALVRPGRGVAGGEALERGLVHLVFVVDGFLDFLGRGLAVLGGCRRGDGAGRITGTSASVGAWGGRAAWPAPARWSVRGGRGGGSAPGRLRPRSLRRGRRRPRRPSAPSRRRRRVR